jgi:hypothetical protein
LPRVHSVAQTGSVRWLLPQYAVAYNAFLWQTAGRFRIQNFRTRRAVPGLTTTQGKERVGMGMAVQIVGSLLVLAGFAFSQYNVLHPKSFPYLLVNAIGAGLLALDAAVAKQWGFLLLEGTWTIVSVVGLVSIMIGRPPKRGPGKQSGVRRTDGWIP